MALQYVRMTQIYLLIANQRTYSRVEGNRITVLFKMLMHAMKFHSDVLWPQYKVNVKWVSNFLYKRSLLCFFSEKFRFELYTKDHTCDMTVHNDFLVLYGFLLQYPE